MFFENGTRLGKFCLRIPFFALAREQLFLVLKEMKVLVSAFACCPSRGSECEVGWTVVNALAREHEVWVMTHEEYHSRIDSWVKDHPLPSTLHFVYFGKICSYSGNPLVGRFQTWKVNIEWHKEVLGVALKLHQEYHFDLVHHVTCATWRVASPLWKLGIPSVWGPVGGGERFPSGCNGILSPVARAFEILRGISNFSSSHSSAIHQAFQNMDACVAANRETYDLVCKLRGREEGVSQLLQVFFPTSKIDAYVPFIAQKDYSEPLRFFAGGVLEARKGGAIALKALAQEKGIPFTYTFGGNGPEREHWRNLASRLGIGDQVVFNNGFSGTAYRDELLKSHIYLLPSLRESAGITLMEAMLAGCVPIVADSGGPHNIVDESCGFRVPVTTPEKMALEIVAHIRRLNADRGLLKTLGLAAHQRIASAYNEGAYLKTIGNIYDEAISKHSATGTKARGINQSRKF